MQIDREAVIAALGGEAAVERLDPESRAEGLEQDRSQELVAAMRARLGIPGRIPTAAELDAQIETRRFRRGAGTLFAAGAQTPIGNRGPGEPETVRRLPPMPARTALLDFLRLRFAPATHVLQSADKALAAGLPEETVLAWRLITPNDLYSFNPNRVVNPEKFTDIIGRHFPQPAEGLGYDNSPVAP
jgi:hypothetical protein